MGAILEKIPTNDLYYLKKSMEDFKGDDFNRLRADYKNFVNANTVPVSKEKLDEIYADIFKDREEFKENNVVQKSIWDGVFVPSNKGQMGPDFNSTMQDARYYFPSRATYENDGKPNVGYGNKS